MEESLILKSFDKFDNEDRMSYENLHHTNVNHYIHKEVPNLILRCRSGKYDLGIKSNLGRVFGEGSWRFDTFSIVHDEVHLSMLLSAIQYKP